MVLNGLKKYSATLEKKNFTVINKAQPSKSNPNNKYSAFFNPSSKPMPKR